MLHVIGLRPVVALLGFVFVLATYQSAQATLILTADAAAQVADHDGDMLGDSTGAVALLSAGYQTGFDVPGALGTIRTQYEWDISSLTAADVGSAKVVFNTVKGSGREDTQFYAGLTDQDGMVTSTDFEAAFGIIPGAVMMVPPVGSSTRGTFEFDVTSFLKFALDNGFDHFAIQGRIDETGSGNRFGLQTWSSEYYVSESNLARLEVMPPTITPVPVPAEASLVYFALILVGSALTMHFRGRPSSAPLAVR